MAVICEKPTAPVFCLISFLNLCFSETMTNHTASSATHVQHPTLLFDGVCNLCNHSVQWVLLRDDTAIFRFAALQSDTGQQLLRQFGLSPEQFNTVVLVDGERIFLRSDAVLEIARRLGGGWQLLYVFKIVPRFLRDAIYNWVAQNRYRWFGRQESCMLPRPEWKGRFV
jgi:predicted DCC family thiol-disulfide oxidoreductase YuxK